ncbi:mitochondrial inner membrane protease subunit 1-like [Zingiber officinale]|uniref:mitochondrial inner membrane protease subunit 1-like n=1 Tax=Zingiber officinale TaxID=94328 RepID=UPI001C4B3CD8|nr:mitochondrial inner membrane protease subunit 1-like [Zingiber officinale]XP_042430620.1 mitochondrial inner membrane protease subunit 1-like [Zingiber officinale]
MAAARGRIAAFLTDAASRLSHIPWRSIGSDALDRASLVVKAACFVHVVNTYIVGIAFVRGPSMLPTINLTGDVVAVERITPRRGTVEVGDVVILISPENPRKTVAKRVVGLQGDAVTFLVDPIHGNATRTVAVPMGHVWVQGDNIYSSRDSRQFGPVPYGLIQGRAFCKVWPPEAVGFIGEKY